MSVLTESCWSLPPAFPTANADAISYGPIPLPISPPLTSSPTSSASLTSPRTGAPTSHSNHIGISRRPSYRMPNLSSSLPNPKDLSIEDDWTRVKDPKEKKRIQNRVAQRTYRHRMKARLGELQARLDNHERQRMQQQAIQLGPDMSNAVAGVTGVGIPFNPNPAAVNGHAGVSPVVVTCPGDTSPSPIALDAQSSHMSMLPQAMYENPAENADRALFSQGTHHLSSPPHSHPSPPQAQNGLLSPPGRSDSEQSAKVSQDFVLDCLRFQSQLLSRLNTVQPDQGYQGQATYGQPEAVPSNVLDNMAAQDQLNCAGSFNQQAPGPDGVDFGFDGPSEAWRADSWANKLRQTSSSGDSMNFQHLSDIRPPMDPIADTNVATGMAPGQAPLAAPAKTAPMDERFETIMHHVQSAGFSSFDELAAAYYSSTFRDTSPLANEQHLSRNRRLPQVISDVCKAADNWTHWERRGLHEEILKTAESIVTSEAAGLHSSVLAQIGPMVEAKGFTQHTADSIQAIKKSLQHELPNSWALNMALASNKDGTWPGDTSSTALAATLLQQFSGNLPKEQLLQLISACL